jgi:branched-subunit amino acid transport protein
MSALLAMLVLAVASWVLRALFIVLVPAERLPARLRESLTHLAPAVLAALVTVEVAGASHGLAAAEVVLMIGALALAAIAVRVTGSLGLAIAIGLGAAVLLDLVVV